MKSSRLEAFSDGVFAVIITIMVLEMKVPQGTDLAALRPVLPVFLSYVFSFIFLGIYWNNHHHLMHAVTRISGGTLWANLHLLFWLSLTPFVTGWMGQNDFAAWPVALYGIVLFCSAWAYAILVWSLTSRGEKNPELAAALGKDLKGKISILIYAVAIPVAFARPLIACALYAVVAITWLIPDRRIERRLG